MQLEYFNYFGYDFVAECKGYCILPYQSPIRFPLFKIQRIISMGNGEELNSTCVWIFLWLKMTFV